MNILVINGPNLNMLGIREPDLYGKETLEDLMVYIKDYCQIKGHSVEFFQSNSEGAIIDAIQQAYGKVQGIVINPAAYTHTSIAIGDAIKTVMIPTVEVHLTDIAHREEFRSISYVSGACVATIVGQHFKGYLKAIDILETLV